MGKVKTRILGLEEVEEAQKKEQKEKAAQKKLEKKKEVKEDAKVEEIKEEKITEPKKEKKAVKVEARVRGKKYQKVVKMADKNKAYSLPEAVKLVREMKTTKFDETVELHFNVDETGLKGEVTFPHSTGRTVKVAVVDDKLLEKLESGKIDFDILVTHPSFMPKLAKFAKILGPKGLMPNPKAGTISPKPEELVKKFSGGTTRWKTEPKFPLVHQMIGKASMEDKNLVENAQAFIEAVGTKHILKAFMKSTMSPSLKLDLGR
ncbi:MAG: 50S ribosomal protein L1 [Patescibacteria group bacterium]